jgi:TetR/AcrR family transcriptional repressor of mexJK operon
VQTQSRSRPRVSRTVAVKPDGTKAAADRRPEKRRGRPLSPVKRARMLSVATRIFLERGYDAASMDAVALGAGVSKATIYSHFVCKRDLFGAIIDSLAGRLALDIGRLAAEKAPPDRLLVRIGKRYLELALAARSLSIHRLVIAEAARTAGLGAEIYRTGPAQLVAALAAYLQGEPALQIENPRLAAEQFLGMVLGHAQLRLLLGAAPPQKVRGEIDQLVEHAVAIFLRGTQVKDGKRPLAQSAAGR